MMMAVILMLALPADGAPKEKPICRTQGVTGSRLGARRICLTAAEWEAREKAARDQLQDRERRNAAISGGP